MKILLAVDGSECSKAAIVAVAERPWPQGSEIEILSAVELPFVPIRETGTLSEDYYPMLEKISREAASKAINDAQTQLQKSQAAQPAITTKVKDGEAKAVILDEAEQWGADLIVLGSHGYRGWQRFWLGSVSHAVATQAPCSVEIVRQRARQ